ncbi:hypothetical protein H7J08_30405 [Mycobacterium frederiksbergense]|uniref:hypothetical protein n=1 Tax=Mycolicibacterium frederiksbergense TaxID=117567 RepID=UPI0021F2CD64|nr:hypothetical protein [Mycolicibacterium frederiksbergense]MCV7048947.1 hypothetical protein [Mycolicibacterium frederiksbergense]
MPGISYIVVIAFLLGVSLIIDGASALWADAADDEARTDGIVAAGCGAVLFFGAAAVYAAGVVDEAR